MFRRRTRDVDRRVDFRIRNSGLRFPEIRPSQRIGTGRRGSAGSEARQRHQNETKTQRNSEHARSGKLSTSKL